MPAFSVFSIVHGYCAKTLISCCLWIKKLLYLHLHSPAITGFLCSTCLQVLLKGPLPCFVPWRAMSGGTHACLRACSSCFCHSAFQNPYVVSGWRPCLWPSALSAFPLCHARQRKATCAVGDGLQTTFLLPMRHLAWIYAVLPLLTHGRGSISPPPWDDIPTRVVRSNHGRG